MLVRHKIPILIVAMTLLCGGCAALNNQLQGGTRPKSPTSDSPNIAAMPAAPAGQLAAMHKLEKLDIGWLFRYYRLASTVPGKALAGEYERAKSDFEAKKSSENQWRLAMLLSIPGTTFYDAERSSTLFKELTNRDSGQDPLLNDAAFLMFSLLNEQNHIGRKSDSLAEQLAELQSANKKLQDQLDALKAIENTLYQRNKAEDNPKP